MTAHPRTRSQLAATVTRLETQNRRLRERLQAIVDWADIAQKNKAEFDSHGVGNLRGPVFDAARFELAGDTAGVDRLLQE